jgi:CspA family cold shock protein
MQKGTVAGLNPKGFGFIKVEGMEKDVFFHSNELTNIGFDALQVGDMLEFEIAESPKGKNAVKVSKI